MVARAREISPQLVAREIDAALRTAIGRRLNKWGRKFRLPPLRWTIEHWEGYVTLVGTPPRRRLRRRSIAARWASRLHLESTSGRDAHWHLAAEGWHLEVHS
ncbi:hypothetical protein [Microbacterium testaceum]|uniref:hypothetical protein n=1 Tax=Microbacterium testaceum TaxID=2033 RepID=UPI001D179F82|nr:hypothetical protein [Microbacterium testaceum]MCC4249796.1 hypothetical protein [Microbacterium testaceum]